MNEHARDVAVQNAIDFYTETPAPVKTKRRTAVKSKAVTYMWEERKFVGLDPEARALGLTNIQAFTRLTLQYYMAYAEVPAPVLNEDGSIQLDNFGRPRSLRKKHIEDAETSFEVRHQIAKGAVWFTRKTLIDAWDGLFGEGLYRELYPNAYMPAFRIDQEFDMAAEVERLRREEIHPKGILADGQSRSTSHRRKLTSSAHRFDTLIDRLLRNGRLARCPYKNGRFMFSKEMCRDAQMAEAWDVHIDRGQRWEGLNYRLEVVDVKTLYRQKNLQHAEPTINIMRPFTSKLGMKHPNQIKWNAVYEKLERYLLFSNKEVAQLAIEEGIFEVGKVKKTTVSEHLETWCSAGKAKRVFPGLYRSEEFWRWNEKRKKFDGIFLPELDWLISFFFYQAPRQFGIPNLTFSIPVVYNWIVSQPRAVLDEWFGVGKEPRKGTVSERLRQALAKDHVAIAGIREWRLTDYVMDATRPFWSAPGDLQPHNPNATHQRTVLLKVMPLDDAIKQVTEGEALATLHMLVTRIMKDEDQTKFERRLTLVARKTFLKNGVNLLRAYTAGELDEY